MTSTTNKIYLLHYFSYSQNTLMSYFFFFRNQVFGLCKVDFEH